MNQSLQEHKYFTFFLIFTAVLCGALIMVIEVLGSRVIGPFFGVGLFVWTSLIAVSLLSLAVGYGIGGWLSDKKAHPDTLYTIILISGLVTLLIPYIKSPVLQTMLPLGLRAGSLTSAMILFSPPLLLLGFVSPFLIKIATKELHTIGRTVGLFYSISTAGSVAGTIITGFYLVPAFGVNNIFLLTGSALIGLSALYFVLFRKQIIALSLLIIPLLMPGHQTNIDKTYANGTHMSQVFNSDTYYGKLQVVEYSNGSQRLRKMLIDGQPQGGIDMNNQKSIFTYANFLTEIPYALSNSKEQSQRGLVIGLGAGIVPNWFQGKGIPIDIVEIDPEVIDVAKQYFFYKTSGKEYSEDARYFLGSTKKQYDYILLDIYSGDLMPGHVVSVEAFSLIKDLLREDAIFAINWIGQLEESFIFSSLYHTLDQAFDHVDIYPNFDTKKEKYGNITIVAYQGEKNSLDINSVKLDSVHTNNQIEFISALAQNYQFTPMEEKIILTDDYNPVDVYNNELREEVRFRIVKSTDPDLLTL